MKTLSWSGKLHLVAFMSLALAGCGGGGGQHNGPPTLPSTSSLPSSCTTGSVGQPYSCQIADTGGKSPFTWSVTGLPAGLSSTVSSDTTSVTISGAPQKPAAIASRHADAAQAAASDPSFTANVSVTVTDAKQRTATLTFTITINEPAALAIQTGSLPTGTVGAAYSATLAATGGTTPYSWTWVAQSGSSLPPGLSLAASSGAVSGTPTASGTFSVTVTVTDSQSPAASANANFSITINAPGALVIATSSLATGAVGSAYSASLSANGGVTPYMWNWTAQSGSSLPPGLNITTNSDNTATISGTPTSSGTFQVTVTVKDSETPTASVSANFSITISALACTAGQTTLCGQFAILVQGFDASGAYALAGSFAANGSGIVGGVVDMNSFGGAAIAVPVTGGAPSGVNVGSDGRGTLTLATSNATVGVRTFAFALDSTGTFATLIEFDDATPTGTGRHASGFLQAQDSTTFNAAAISGNFAFGFHGGDNAGGRYGMLGLAVLGTTGCGLNSNGSTTTTNDGGSITRNISFICGTSTGLSAIDPSTGRGTITFTYSPAIASSPLDYSFYVIGGGKLVFLVTDAGAVGIPVLSGLMKRQRHHPNGFSSADLACGGSGAADTACIFADSASAGGGTHVQTGSIVQVSPGSYTMKVDDNKAGIVGSGTLTSGAVVISGGGNGTLTCPQCSPTDFVLTDTDTAIILGENGGVFFGNVSPQTGRTFNTAPGTFIIGSDFAGSTAVPCATGVFTPSAPGGGGAGTFVGTLDVEQIFASPFLVSGAGVSGNYTLDATIGRATGSSTSPGPLTFVFWVIDAQDLVMMETDSSNPNPVLIFIRQ